MEAKTTRKEAIFLTCVSGSNIIVLSKSVRYLKSRSKTGDCQSILDESFKTTNVTSSTSKTAVTVRNLSWNGTCRWRQSERLTCSCSQSLSSKIKCSMKL